MCRLPGDKVISYLGDPTGKEGRFPGKSSVCLIFAGNPVFTIALEGVV